VWECRGRLSVLRQLGKGGNLIGVADHGYWTTSSRISNGKHTQIGRQPPHGFWRPRAWRAALLSRGSGACCGVGSGCGELRGRGVAVIRRLLRSLRLRDVVRSALDHDSTRCVEDGAAGWDGRPVIYGARPRDRRVNRRCRVHGLRNSIMRE
jgi:hypothetical protein